MYIQATDGEWSWAIPIDKCPTSGIGTKWFSTPNLELDDSESVQKYFQIKIDTYHRVPFGVWYCCYQNPTLHVMILVLYLKWACLTGISGQTMSASQLERASHCTTFSSTRSWSVGRGLPFILALGTPSPEPWTLNYQYIIHHILCDTC